MIIKRDVVRKIFDFVNTVKTDNYYKFESNKNGLLSIYGTDSYSYFKLDTNIPWDIDSSSYFTVNLPNMGFIDSDIRIDIDNDYVYFYYGSGVLESVIKLLQINADSFEPEYSFAVDNKIDMTLSYDEYKSYFKTLLKHTNANGDDFTSCIYADNHTLFSTDKMSSCWFSTEKQLFNNDKILIDTKFINMFLKLDGFTTLDLIYTNTKIGFIIFYEEQNFTISYLTSTLFLNYPDFKTLFNKFDYINSVEIDSKEMIDALTSIIRFDSKCDRVKITFDPNSSIVLIKEQSTDNSKFIELNISDVESLLQFDGEYNFSTNPHLLLKSIQDTNRFTIWFNHTKIQPILLTCEQTPFRKYIQVYHA